MAELHIGIPKIILTDSGRARLTASVDGVAGHSELWLEVSSLYGEYLCSELSDAFVFGLLNLAQRKHLDIVCDAPMSADLHYRITSALIPALAKHGRKLYATKIVAHLVEDDMPNVGAVGTGLSCGVDSLHVLKNHLGHPISSLRLTHVVLNNCGAFQEGTGQYDRSLVAARKLAEQLGLKLVDMNSNIASLYGVGFELFHTYANMFCVLALRKLWKTFFYGSSGYDFGSFTLQDNDFHDCARYEILSLNCISTNGLNIISEGAAESRLEKTCAVARLDLAKEYLNVCVTDSGANCSFCEKCRRTLINLDALGMVGEFGHVFDLNVYRANRSRYLGWAIGKRILGGGEMTNKAVSVLLSRGDVAWSAWLWALAYMIKAIMQMLKAVLQDK